MTLQEFFTDSWKDPFLFFLKQTRVKYEVHLFLKKESFNKFNYSSVSKQEKMFSAFEEVNENAKSSSLLPVVMHCSTDFIDFKLYFLFLFYIRVGGLC